jgi:hypothetical protein
MKVRLNITDSKLAKYVVVNNYSQYTTSPTVYLEENVCDDDMHESTYDAWPNSLVVRTHKNIKQLLHDLICFNKNTNPILVLTTNANVKVTLLQKETIQEFNRLLRFTMDIYESVRLRLAKDIFNTSCIPTTSNTYNAIYISLSKEHSYLKYSHIVALSNKIISIIDLQVNTVLVCNDLRIKIKVSELLQSKIYPYEFEVSDLKYIIQNYLILSGAKNIFRFSEYDMEIEYAPRYDLNNEFLLYTVIPKNQYIVSTVAGSLSETPGNADGQGRNAYFYYPSGVTYAPNGTIYVADTNNNEIRKIHSGNIVTTLAGTFANAPAMVNGIGSSALFDAPTGLTTDSSGILYVVDSVNAMIRKITPDGVVTTFAGSTPGFTNGVGQSAQFKFLYA